MNPFFELYKDLKREGPGEIYDVQWAARVAGLRPDARICDVACGSGADTHEWLRQAPKGHVAAFDKQPSFVAEARERIGENPRLALGTGDMTKPLAGGSFDMIWCAGAVYFMGLTKALELWRPALAKNGVIGFSEICWWVDNPSNKARNFWAESYPTMTNEDGIKAHIDAAGFEIIGRRQVSENGWGREFYDVLEKRIGVLRHNILHLDANPKLTPILDETQNEIEVWKECSHEYGYLISLVRPK